MNPKENLAYALALDYYNKEYFERVILPVANQFDHKCLPEEKAESGYICSKCNKPIEMGVACSGKDSEAYIVALLRECGNQALVIDNLFSFEITKDYYSICKYKYESDDQHFNKIENSSKLVKKVYVADLRHRITLEPEKAEQYNEAIAVLEGAE